MKNKTFWVTVFTAVFSGMLLFGAKAAVGVVTGHGDQLDEIRTEQAVQKVQAEGVREQLVHIRKSLERIEKKVDRKPGRRGR